MINPLIFSFNLGSFVFALRWYGVLVMTGVSVGAWFASREVTRRGEQGDTIWDLLVWILPAGIIGARICYVLNAIFDRNHLNTSTVSLSVARSIAVILPIGEKVNFRSPKPVQIPHEKLRVYFSFSHPLQS